MGIFNKFKGKANKKETGEITLQGIQENNAKLDQASSYFLSNLGPAFTGTKEGHIVTDIAGASAIAGLMALRSTAMDLSGYEPGNVVLGEEINQKQDPVLRYISAISQNMGIDPNKAYDSEAVDENKPLFDTIELTHKLEQPFYESCRKADIPKLYYPIVAALTAMKLVGAGKELKLLDPNIGTSIAMHYVVAGSKTVPYTD